MGATAKADPRSGSKKRRYNPIGPRYNALQPLASGVLSKLTAGTEAALTTTNPTATRGIPMFETMLYIVAIVAVLAFFGEPRHTTTEDTPAPATEPTAEPIEPAATVTTEPTEPATAEPQTEPATEALNTVKPWHEMTTTELRKACQDAGIQWRNVYGKKHLRKPEMIAALS